MFTHSNVFVICKKLNNNLCIEIVLYKNLDIYYSTHTKNMNISNQENSQIILQTYTYIGEKT